MLTLTGYVQLFDERNETFATYSYLQSVDGDHVAAIAWHDMLGVLAVTAKLPIRAHASDRLRSGPLALRILGAKSSRPLALGQTVAIGRTAAFSPNNERFATWSISGNDDAVRLWRLDDSGEAEADGEFLIGPLILRVHFSGDASTIVVVTVDGTAVGTRDGRVVRFPVRPDHDVSDARLSERGDKLFETYARRGPPDAPNSAASCRVWDVASATPMFEPDTRVFARNPISGTWHPDGRLVVVSASKIAVYDGTTALERVRATTTVPTSSHGWIAAFLG